MKHMYRSILIAILLLLLPAACRAEKYALLIGLDKYPKRAYNLDSLVADIHGVAEVLRTNCAYRLENIQILVGEGKTKVKRQEILDSVANFATRIKPDDTVFFFWSGHGCYLDGEDCVMPYDVNPRNRDTARQTVLKVQEMLAPLMHIRTRALLLFFNMCRCDDDEIFTENSTQGDTSALPKPGIPPTDASAPQQKVAFYSSTEGQFSYMWLAKHRSMFGYYLEQGLRGAAADAKGEIHVDNLVGYVQKAVYGRCQQEYVYTQRPYVVTSGPEALHLTLASGLPPGKGGATAVPTVVGDSVDDRFDAAFQSGTELWEQQHYEEARLQFEEAGKLKPENVYVLGVLANDNYAMNRYDDAERYCRKAMELLPKNDSMVAFLGQIEYLRKDYEQAEKFCRQAMKMNPKSSTPVYLLGNIYSEIKHDEKAAFSLYEKAAQLEPNDPNPLNAMGLIYKDRNDYVNAESIFRKIMEAHPDYGSAVANLAWIVCNIKKDIPEAERLYLKAIELEPLSSWDQCSLGLLYQGKKDYAEAEKRFRKAMELDPENNYPIQCLADMDYDRQDYKAAEILYRRALEHDPQNAQLLFHVGYCRDEAKDYPEAEKLYRKALEIDPKNEYALNDLARILQYVKKDIQEAEKLYLKAIELDPKEATYANNLGKLYYEKNDIAAAEPRFRKAIELAPSEGFYHANLAGCLLKENQKDAALVEAKKALELGFKDSCDAYTALGLNPK